MSRGLISEKKRKIGREKEIRDQGYILCKILWSVGGNVIVQWGKSGLREKIT